MPNNFVFDTAPQDLKAQIYGDNGGQASPVAVSGSGVLSVTIENQPVVTIGGWDEAVTGLVSVTNTASVSVANQPDVTINGWDEAVTGLVSVINTASVVVENQPNVTIGDWLETVTGEVNLQSVSTVSESATATVTGESSILEEDTSMLKEYSYYIFNHDTSPITVCLQVSPTTTDEYYVDDTATQFTVPADGKLVLAPKYYLNYTRLWYDTGAETPDFEAYFNAHV